jgi:hypothetical protein
MVPARGDLTRSVIRADYEWPVCGGNIDERFGGKNETVLGFDARSEKGGGGI